MRRVVPEISETSNLLISDVTINEVDNLQSICESWSTKEILEGERFKPDYIRNCVLEGDLPPIKDASQEYYRCKSIHLRDSSKLIGFYDLYHGYPEVTTLWIGMFLISSVFHKKGYGQEIINLIKKEAKEAGYNKLGIGVYLKNWPALRFWTKCGFDKITGIHGHKEFSQDTFALLGLEHLI
ncbi:GNAT family N-acetyltransferase [Vallitalea okinawensis]|uniref:GNAT family N-acetyltransferase n=1 Tax=Vallitalea okinawensis TaxID=2078660 RepID=UPI000CFC1075|nr:GNAT family N-acetyltransferase [Vallitalea okinawensis]